MPARLTNRREECVVTYVVAQPCVDVLDKSCVDECPVDCIYEGDRMLYIQPDECVDCGACEPVCPVQAIYYQEDLPAEWAEFTEANAQFFAKLGSPGGAAKVGRTNDDPPLIADLPLQPSSS
jgi:NAD-dependent dihydropyrimidine dehydrogenase PreA subunit